MVTRGKAWVSLFSKLSGSTLTKDELISRFIPILVLKNSTQKFPTDTNGRRKRLREVVFMKRDHLKQTVERNALEMQVEVQKRRKIIQQSLKLRKDKFKDTELKRRE